MLSVEQIEKLEQEILKIILEIYEISKEYTKEDLIYKLMCIFEGIGNTEMSVKIIKDNYIIYLHSSDCRDIINCKYVTKNKKEMFYIIISYLINDYIWDKVVDRYSDGREVEYTEEVDNFEKALKDNIIKQLPVFYKKFYNKDNNIYNRFERFTDTEAYRQWLIDCTTN